MQSIDNKTNIRNYSLLENRSDQRESTTQYTIDPTVKITSLRKGKHRGVELIGNKIFFIVEGSIDFQLAENQSTKIKKGEFIFVPADTLLIYSAIEDCSMMVVPISACLKLGKKEAVEIGYTNNGTEQVQIKESRINLEMNEVMWDFVLGLSKAIEYNMISREYFEIKLQELFILLREIYSKEQLKLFFQNAVNLDTDFYEFVNHNWLKYNSVNKLSDAMNLSVQHFTKKFKMVFGVAPGQWIMQEKAWCILKEIQDEKKTFQQIAFDYGFSAVSNFNRFCKIMLLETPSEIRNKAKVLIK